MQLKIGDKFTRLTVIKIISKGVISVKCICGAIREVKKKMLLKETVRSCGCLRREMMGALKRTHGRTRTTEYHSWMNMRRRCNDPKNKDYHNYGGRGISVCERWEDFQNFFSDMGTKPTPAHQIDRIDNNGNYEPGNAHWTTLRVNQGNKQSSFRITYKGVTHCALEWERIFGFKRGVIRRRIQRGWSLERAFSTPAVLGRNQFS